MRCGRSRLDFLSIVFRAQRRACIMARIARAELSHAALCHSRTHHCAIVGAVRLDGHEQIDAKYSVGARSRLQSRA
jgi:hypothetical protein